MCVNSLACGLCDNSQSMFITTAVSVGMTSFIVGTGLPAWRSTRGGGERRKKAVLEKMTSLKNSSLGGQNTGDYSIGHSNPFIMA